MGYCELYRDLGTQLIKDFDETNEVCGGINGPYDDPETPVRNLAHLIVLTSIEITVFNRKDLIKTLKIMAAKLSEMADDNYLFRMRVKDGKDICNGVIGHAWVIEAYIYLYKALHDSYYLDIAKKIYCSHKYDKCKHLWHRPDYLNENNCDTSIDYTLNHQLWFAASALELLLLRKDAQIENESNDFLEYLNKNMWVHHDGLICHPIYYRVHKQAFAKQLIKYSINIVKGFLGFPSFLYREEGYHVFDVMALARIRNACPDSNFFLTPKSKKPVKYLKTRHFSLGINSDKYHKDPTISYENFLENETIHNIYAYPYNVTGFEMLYISSVYRDFNLEDIANQCMNEQHIFTYDTSQKRIGLNCHDKITCNYRVYEYYRYLEIKKQKLEK